MITLHLRDNQSHESSIEDMEFSPFPANQLLTEAKELIRNWQYGAKGRVKTEGERLKRAKKEGEDETGSFDYLAPNVIDLGREVLGICRATNVGEDAHSWTITVECASGIFVFLMLMKTKDFVWIVDFQIAHP